MTSQTQSTVTPRRPRPPNACSLHDAAQTTRAALAEQDERWLRGKSTRRTFLGGLGMVGVAALGSQLMTGRAAYALGAEAKTTNTLIVLTLRGGLDGLQMLIPAASSLGLDDLRDARPDLVPGDSGRVALPGGRGWAVNSALSPLLPLWKSGELAFVPAVMSPGATRSHFESYRNLQSGSATVSTTGWLDRVLDGLGPGTTFRAMGMGEATTPLSWLGDESSLVLNSLADFTVPAAPSKDSQTLAAIESLYRGLPTGMTQPVEHITAALRQATSIRSAAGVRNAAKYPIGAFGRALADLATVLRSEVGLQVCTVDVGGWDTHSNEAAAIVSNLNQVASGLAAFMQDLGPTRRSRVTVLVQTEFGRRVAQNGNVGTDHGLGSVIMIVGGGLSQADVFGGWVGVAPSVLNQGDVPGTNNPFDVMLEVADKRLGRLSPSTIFPDHDYAPLGIFTT